MFTALAAVAVTGSFAQFNGRAIELMGFGESMPRMQVLERTDRVSPPKISPKHKWEFEWITSAYGTQERTETRQLGLKFQVFSQLRKSEGDPSMPLARMLIRLWDYNVRELRIDHRPLYNNGTIDVYLCFGGEAGGEQLFDEEIVNGFGKKVNTIYIYRITSYSNALEMAREGAHEYGHAVLPAIGGFETPEEWANGYLGEKIYLRYLRDEIQAKRLSSDDAMGATLEELNRYVAQEVDPIWRAVAKSGPNMALLGGKGQTAMNAYIGLALYAERILPTAAFARSLNLTGSYRATDYPQAIVAAASELPKIDLSVPAEFIKKPLWIPMKVGSKMSGATAQKRSGDWVLVVSQGPKIQISNPLPK